MKRRRHAALALTLLLALVVLVLAARDPDETDGSAMVALAAADWARRGGDPADCIGVPGDGRALVVHCGTGAERQTYVPDGAGVRLLEPQV